MNLTFVPLDEMGPTGKGHKSQSARDFVSFYNEVKEKKVHITNKDILKFSKLFEVTATFWFGVIFFSLVINFYDFRFLRNGFIINLYIG